MTNQYLKNISAYSNLILIITIIALIISIVTFDETVISLGIPFIDGLFNDLSAEQTTNLARGLFATRISLSFVPIIILNLLITFRLKKENTKGMKAFSIISFILSIVALNLIFIIPIILIHLLLLRNIAQYESTKK